MICGIMTLKIAVFWVVTLCSLVGAFQHVKLALVPDVDTRLFAVIMQMTTICEGKHVF